MKAASLTSYTIKPKKTKDIARDPKKCRSARGSKDDGDLVPLFLP